MGRLASVLAKRLLNGEEIVVVKAEKAVVTGDRAMVFAQYDEKRRLGKHQMRRKGPFPPRRPDRILKRAVRGMLPYQKARGREALKRLRVYVGVPPSVQAAEAERIPEAAEVRTPQYVTLGQLSKALGGKG